MTLANDIVVFIVAAMPCGTAAIGTKPSGPASLETESIIPDAVGVCVYSTHFVTSKPLTSVPTIEDMIEDVLFLTKNIHLPLFDSINIPIAVVKILDGRGLPLKHGFEIILHDRHGV